MESKLLIILMGLPRSGKSTWAKKESMRLGAPIVNPDSIRLALYGKAYIRSMEPYVWAIAYTMVDSLFTAGHDTIIVDATNINKASRDKWARYSPEFHYIDTPMDVCLERAHKGCREDLLDVIKSMDNKFEPLTEEEYPYVNRN